MGLDVVDDRTTILIPAYNPDEKLLALLPRLRERFRHIVLVNDGSTTGKDVFERAVPLVDAILVHEKNRGKGAALKTGLAYIGDATDVITADADGQHTPEDIAKLADGLKSHRDGLVLGVRSFSGKVPLRSRFGNWWTRWFFFLMTGLMIRDTQTGLRGIPAALVPRVAKLPGDRYEYEMTMLADAKRHPSRPLQIPIETVYLDENATSHFNPVLDAIRIYRSLFQFCISSVLSFLIDNGVFAAVMWVMAAKDTPSTTGSWSSAAATFRGRGRIAATTATSALSSRSARRATRSRKGALRSSTCAGSRSPSSRSSPTRCCSSRAILYRRSSSSRVEAEAFCFF